MRLKYYLRGVGIGIIITTIIFMISISLHRDDMKQQNTADDNNKSTTISEAEENAQKEDSEAVSIEERDTGKTDTDKSKQDKTNQDKSNTEKPDTDKTNTGKADADKQDANNANKANSDKADQDKSDTGKTNADKSDTGKPNDTDTKTDSQKEEKVRFEIKGGEFSDTVCQKLKEAGLIDDAKAFNTYLIQKDFDNLILPGIYDIPKDSTYEEIAALLTAKVE